MDVDGCRLHGRDLRNAFGYFERLGRGDYLYGSGECAYTCDCDADRSVSGGRNQDHCRDHHGHASAAGGHRVKSDDDVGTDRSNSEPDCHGDERPAESGSDVGVDGRGLFGRNLRDVVDCFERLGHGDNVHRTGDSADSANSIGDSRVGFGHHQDYGGDDHDYFRASDGECESEACGVDDRPVANFHSDGIGKLEYFRDVGSGLDSWRQLFGGDDQHGGSVRAAIERGNTHGRRSSSGGLHRGGDG